MFYGKNEHFGTCVLDSMSTAIKSKQNMYKELGIDVNVSDVPFIVTVITPVMRRAHEQMKAGEIVFIDSSGSCNQSNSCITFMFGSTKLGGIPLGCVIHQLQTEENYLTGFSQIKLVLGNQAFGGKGHPKVIMTDDSLAERKALKSVFFKVHCFFVYFMFTSLKGLALECKT